MLKKKESVEIPPKTERIILAKLVESFGEFLERKFTVKTLGKLVVESL